MPIARPGSHDIRRRRRHRNLASIAGLLGLLGLGVVAVIMVSLMVATFTNTYLAGLVLGGGLVVATWVASVAWRRVHERPAASLGRSRTLDCRQARWAPRHRPSGVPHPPTEAQRRVRPCPGSRHK